MRRSLALACLAVVPVFCANASAVPRLPLAHAGRWIIDARGRVVVLHGTNMVYKLPPYYPQAAGFGNGDAAFLARIGFNAVRVGVIWKALEPRPGVYDEHYLAKISQTVATLARHRIVSLLDFHQDMYNERFQGEGAPDWAVQDDGLPAQPKEGFNQNYLVMPALQRAYDHFWANSPGPGAVGLEDRYAAAWRHVAQRFRSNHHVLGYELFNEPWPGTAWQQCAQPAGCPVFDATLTQFNRRTTAAIRRADPSTLVWYEPNVLFDFGADTNLGPTGDHSAGFAFHSYCLEAATTGSSKSCATTADLTFGQALRHAQQSGDALLMTEFGDGSVPLITEMVRRADRNMTPWLEWSYCPCHDPTGPSHQSALVLDPRKPARGSNLNLAGLHALVEPYPQVIAGTPQGWRFDPATRTFTLRYSSARASGHGRFRRGSVTEIAVPSLVYPHGYAIRVTGAAIRSRRGARVLTLTLCRRSSRVSLTVAPSGRSRSSCRARAPRR